MAASSFFDLPIEIRRLIYKEHFTIWSATIEFDDRDNRFKLKGLPDLAILLANKATRAESSQVLGESFSGRLRLNDVKICRKHGSGYRSSLEVVESLCLGWLLQRITTITVDHGTTGMLPLLPWYKFPSLNLVELELNLTTNPFAPGRISQFWPFEAVKSPDGDCTICDVHGYNNWTVVPLCVKEGRVKVVSIKRGFSSGACLRATVEHKAEHGEFIERVCENGSGGWTWIINEAGSL